MKTSRLRRWTSFAVSLLMITSLITPAMAQEVASVIASSFEALPESKVSVNDFDIKYNQEDLNLRYGDYAEIEFSADVQEEVEFSIDEKMFPVGLQIDNIGTNTALLAGAPEFLEQFCFALIAKSKTSDKEASERVCLFSEQNEEIDHPKFETQRELNPFVVGENSSSKIRLEPNFSYIEPAFVLGELPEGVELKSGKGELELFGKTDFTGVFEFVALAQTDELYVYKQFQVEIKPGSTTVYQCARGYYYDETVGYCVQNQGDICEDGTFYDPDRNRCVRYTTPPHVSCAPGTYFDHFLYRCVRVGYNRCPYNYKWDPYSNRCQRLPYSCSMGFRYSHITRSCVYVGAFRCGINEHYSSYYGRCVSNFRFCRAGQYWDGFSCRNTRRICGGINRYFDPVLRICRSTRYYHSCGAGSVFSYNAGRCVRRRFFGRRTCGIGTRYSTRRGRCVDYRSRPNRRVVTRRPVARRPIRVRPHRPDHRTHRPNRPDRPHHRPDRPHRPNRPSTRPDRPHRPNRPSTRPDRPHRPNRPSTRPDRPHRPNRPSTRPDRPHRPNRPSTRPDRPHRPNRPSTRPDRPSRPNRPSTRPDRPSRPNRPSTRPSRPSRPTTRPSRPSHPSRPSTRPNRPSRGSGSSHRPGRGSDRRSGSSASQRGARHRRRN